MILKTTYIVLSEQREEKKGTKVWPIVGFSHRCHYHLKTFFNANDNHLQKVMTPYICTITMCQFFF